MIELGYLNWSRVTAWSREGYRGNPVGYLICFFGGRLLVAVSRTVPDT